jgi:uptake hydrogenase small subunit
MRKTLLWIESGGCSGESMAILGLDGPSATGGYNLAQFLEDEAVRLLWHPSLSLESPLQLLSIVDSIVSGREELTLFCVEGSVINGPNGTGMYDSIHGKPKRDLIAALCNKAEYVLAMGTCAAFGGLPAAPPNPTDSSGLQFSLDKPGGVLRPEWRSRAGFPVFNLSGCPVDAVTMLRTMSLIINGAPPALDTLNRPVTVRPCLSDESRRKCRTAEKVGYSCYNCIGARFPINKRLFRHAGSCQLGTGSHSEKEASFAGTSG